MEGRKVTLSWLPRNFDQESFNKKYDHILNPDEYLSEKIKKISVSKDIDDSKLPKYIVSLEEAKQSFNNSITVYKLKKDVIEKILNTKIERMPNEIPEIFYKPFIIETFDDNDSLFGDTNSIVGYFSSYVQELIKAEESSDGMIYGTIHKKTENKKTFTLLIHGMDKENSWQDAADYLNNKKEISGSIKYLGYNIFYWQPLLEKTNWEFTKKDYNRPILMNKKYCLNCIHSETCNKDDRYMLKDTYEFCFEGLCDNIMSFITILNYMLKAENSPIAVEKVYDKVRKTVKSKKNKIITKNEDWIIRYLYIDKRKNHYERNNQHAQLEKEGYKLKDVKVKGHLRYQAYGTEFKQHRWIYIESFVSSKWMKDGDTKIIVSYK
jgi:hypothetical protein